MTIPAMHHVMVAIPVGGEETARRFYGDLLGLTEVPKQADMRHRGGLWFLTGTIDFHIGADPAFQPTDKPHVAWQVDDLDGLRSMLDAAGHETFDDIPLDGYRRFQVRDPFGNRVELLTPLP